MLNIKAILPVTILLAFQLFSCSDAPTTEEQSNKSVDSTTVIENEISETSNISCPKCGHTENEELPTDVCLLKYDCKECAHTMTPDSGDCCVFCTYGDHKCPSMQ